MTEQKEGKCLCCVIAGAVILVLGLFADQIGVGGGLGYGIKQIAVVVVGIVLIIVGLKPCKFDKFCKLGKK